MERGAPLPTTVMPSGGEHLWWVSAGSDSRLQAAIAAVSVLVSGCTVTNEGLTAGRPQPGESAIVESRKQQGYRVQAGIDVFMPPRLILVGEISSFRRFDDATKATYYDSYEKFARAVHPGEPAAVSPEQFQQLFEGWTKLKYGPRYEDALVPFSLRGEVSFPSPVGVFLVQSTGDLVAARSNADGFYVVDTVLCKDDSGYSACAKQYVMGVFDAGSGVELDGELRPRKVGKAIDVGSYKQVR